MNTNQFSATETSGTSTKHKWPRRRSPIPEPFLYGQILSRRIKGNSLSLSQSTQSSHSSFSDTGSDTSWDSETIASSSEKAFSISQRSDSGTLSFGPQNKQQKQEVNALNRQLDAREAEISEYLELMYALELKVGDAERRAKLSDIQTIKHEEQVQWYENELKDQQECMLKAQRDYRKNVLRLEESHQNEMDDVNCKLVLASSEAERLAKEVGRLAMDLGKTKYKYNNANEVIHYMLAGVNYVREGISQATSTVTHLSANLADLSTCISEIEEQVRLFSCAITTQDQSYVDKSSHASSNLLDIMDSSSQIMQHRSLYSEINAASRFTDINLDTKVSHSFPTIDQLSAQSDTTKPKSITKNCSNGNSSDDPVIGTRTFKYAGPTSLKQTMLIHTTKKLKKERLQKVTESSNNSIQDMFNAGPSRPGIDGILYSTAIFMHLLCALFIRIWLRPIMYLIWYVFRATVNVFFLVPLMKFIDTACRIFLPHSLQHKSSYNVALDIS